MTDQNTRAEDRPFLQRGDVITYRPVHADVTEPHRAIVEDPADDAVCVSELAPGPAGLTHKLTWDRIIAVVPRTDD
jgi:hypothetical protein